MEELVRRVYQAFGLGPLTAGQRQLYVNLDEVRGKVDVRRRLAEKIRLSAGPTCQVLAGHRGSGKSTELRMLQHELEHPSPGADRYFVVLCEADDDVDRNDVDFPDVLIAIVRQMAAQLKAREKISLQPGYFKKRFEELKTFLGSDVNFEGLELELGLLKLSGVIKGSPDARLNIRRLLEPDTSNLLQAANDKIGEAILELKKRDYANLVILIDDLDKMILRPHDKAGCPTTEYLFVHRAAQLTAFLCHTLYTMPLSLAYSHQEQNIKNNYGGHVPVIPMTKIATHPPSPKAYLPGMEKFRQVIAARLREAGATEKQVFASAEARDDLIRLTGGQPTALMTLVREAIVAHGLPIDTASLGRARAEGRREYARLLRDEHQPLLDKVRTTGNMARTSKNEPLFRELLESRAILQYVNDDEWYGVNPLIAAPPRPVRRRRSK
jgi:energy-coupling factor transporter ATP-binding protein EcfA2